MAHVQGRRLGQAGWRNRGVLDWQQAPGPRYLRRPLALCLVLFIFSMRSEPKQAASCSLSDQSFDRRSATNS